MPLFVVTATPVAPLAPPQQPVALCDGNDRSEGKYSGPSDLQGSVAPGSVSHRFVGADGVEPEAVGGDERAVSFGVAATFATVDACLAAVKTLMAGVPAVAEIKVDGAVWFQRAAISWSYAVSGCSLLVNYSLRGF